MRADRERRNDTSVKNGLRRIANIFVPLIPALIACGIIAGLNGLVSNLVTSGDLPWLSGIPPLLAPISGGFLSLIAVFVGINTAREFGGTPVIGGAVAGIVVYAGVADVSAFGQQLQPGQGGVIGALMAALLAVYLERWIRSWCPDGIAMLVVPTLTVLVTGLVTLLVLMSLAGWIASGIAEGVTWMLAHGGPFTGFILAGLFLPMVMLGLHQTLIPIHTTLIEQDGYTVPAGLLGVGEPLIYGVTLPLGRPFVTACGGAAVAGAWMSTMNMLGTSVGSSAIGPSGWAMLPLLNGNRGIGFAILVYGVGEVIAYAAGFGLTWFFGFSAERLEELNCEEADVRAPDPLGDGRAADSAPDAPPDAASAPGARERAPV